MFILLHFWDLQNYLVDISQVRKELATSRMFQLRLMKTRCAQPRSTNWAVIPSLLMKELREYSWKHLSITNQYLIAALGAGRILGLHCSSYYWHFHMLKRRIHIARVVNSTGYAPGAKPMPLLVLRSTIGFPVVVTSRVARQNKWIFCFFRCMRLKGNPKRPRLLGPKSEQPKTRSMEVWEYNQR